MESGEDESSVKEVAQETASINTCLQDMKTKVLLGEESDTKNAYINLNSGSGGTESQDWAQMLLRMYQRWCDKKGFSSNLIEHSVGEEAGIKSATLFVKGEYAFGLLRTESGVHRLVRISPFDSNKRRHTSFASVFIYPEVDENVEIEINEGDLRIDVYRASGAGGQHVNTTDSAVRLTHKPSGIVVTCQNERSQHKNRATAMKMLRARLYEQQQEKERAEREQVEANKKANEWGSQIRSYVLHPYKLVKDHRTGEETSSALDVLDGDLDSFMMCALSKEKETQSSK